MNILLNGGGCAEKTKEIYTFLNKIINNSKPILCIPLARDRDDSGYENSKVWLQNELNDIDYSGLVMADSSDYISKMNLNDFGLIYISGGNTYKLLKELKDTEAFNKIRAYFLSGGIIYGSSAGAAIFGASLRSIAYADKNDVKLQNIQGYDLFSGISIAAHYTNKNEEKTQIATEYLIQLSKTEPVVALPEEDTIYIHDGLVTVFGSRDYYIFRNGVRKAFTTGQTMPKEVFLNL